MCLKEIEEKILKENEEDLKLLGNKAIMKIQETKVLMERYQKILKSNFK